MRTLPKGRHATVGAPIILVFLWQSAAFGAPESTRPFEIFAVYTQKSTGGTEERTIHLDSSAQPFPPVAFIDPPGATFKEIVFATKSDELSKLRLRALQIIVVESCGDRGCESKKLLPTPGQKRNVYTESVSTPSAIRELHFDVFEKFTEDFLCNYERIERICPSEEIACENQIRTPEKKRLASPTTKPLVSKNEYNALADAFLFDFPVLGGDEKPIVYSFCPGTYQSIDWRAVAAYVKRKPQVPLTDLEVDEVHQAQKAALVEKLASRLRKAGYDIELAKKDKEKRDNIYAKTVHRVSLISGLADFQVYEGTGTDPLDERVVDKAASLYLDVSRHSRVCDALPCNNLLSERVSTRTRYHDDKGNLVTKKSQIRSVGGGRWNLGVDLSDLMGKAVEIELVADVDDGKELQLMSRTTHVENLGWITTFPGATEIVSLFQGTAKQPADIETTSTIPISYAINLSNSESSRAAVTLPFVASFNPRKAPRLAEFFKVFAHASLVFPLGTEASMATVDSGTPRWAFGAGVALASAFTFSVGWTVEDPKAFLLIGISAPDLVKSWRLSE